MIQFKRLSKFFDDKKALEQVSLTIHNGEIFGLIGHNGAGKSTLIKTLVSILDPSEGTVEIDGLELSKHRDQLKPRIAYVPDSPNIFPQLTAGEYWDFVRHAYQVPEVVAEKRLNQYQELFNMKGQINKLISSFSHGMKQKTILIATLMANPDIWVLDEPMTGLDPQAIHDLRDIMRTHANAGHTVLFSSHDLSMAESICDRIAILKEGQLLYTGTVQDLRASHGNQRFEDIYLSMAGRQVAEQAQISEVRSNE